MQKRIERLRAKLEEADLDALIVGAAVEDTFHTHAANRRYLSGFTGSMGYLLITKDQALIAVDFRYFEQAEKESPDFQLYKANGPMATWLPSLVKEAGLGHGKKIGFEPGDFTVATYQNMTKALESIPARERPKLVSAPPLIEQLRAIKDPEELALIQQAIDLGDSAFEHVAQRIQPGWTEKQVALEIERYVREHGGDGMSFETIVAAGPWGAMPHAQPRDYVIQEGEGVVIDMGVRVQGYCSDLTRTIFVGEPDEQFQRIYNIVLTAQMTAAELIETGMTGEAAHMIAHNVIEEAGYGDTFGHGLGHGVGLQIHESPRVGRTSPDVLEDGMVITIEPGIYIQGWGGVRIEDMAVMENGKARILSHAPKLQLAK